MSIPFILEIVALVIAIIVEVRAVGRDWLGWAVICICAALLWGRIG